jgi:hypothetical protein
VGGRTSKEAEFRKRAVECRRLAAGTTLLDFKRFYLDLASDWEFLAEIASDWEFLAEMEAMQAAVRDPQSKSTVPIAAQG